MLLRGNIGQIVNTLVPMSPSSIVYYYYYYYYLYSYRSTGQRVVMWKSNSEPSGKILTAAVGFMTKMSLQIRISSTAYCLSNHGSKTKFTFTLNIVDEM